MWAPRQVEETQEATVQEIILIKDTETQTTDSQVQVITETENDRDIQARVVGKAVIIPYNKGDKAMSEREADEEARHGEVLRWSTESDNGEVTQRGPETTFGSDTTGSTPDCCKSPDKMGVLVTGEIVQVQDFEFQARQHKTKLNYEGQSFVAETEAQESDDDSEDNVLIASVLTKPKTTNQVTEGDKTITQSEVQPEGAKAIGLTVA
jgi:hypothetical protein